MTDDAMQFEEERRSHLEALSADSAIKGLSLDLIAAADRHHFSYLWDWLGLPIIQMPSEIVATQEVIWRCRPEVVVETGIARGGSLVFLASILQLIGGDGIVVGIDIDLRSHNRARIEEHPLAKRIELIDGSSTSDEVVQEVRSRVGDRSAMVILDSDHVHDHVLAELRIYGDIVTKGQYLVVADTVVEDIPVQEHRPRPWGPGNNPKTALAEYLKESDHFEVDDALNAKLLMSSSQGGFVRRVR